jgi:hypothetical protein
MSTIEHVNEFMQAYRDGKRILNGHGIPLAKLWYFPGLVRPLVGQLQGEEGHLSWTATGRFSSAKESRYDLRIGEMPAEQPADDLVAKVVVQAAAIEQLSQQLQAMTECYNQEYRARQAQEHRADVLERAVEIARADCAELGKREQQAWEELGAARIDCDELSHQLSERRAAQLEREAQLAELQGDYGEMARQFTERGKHIRSQDSTIASLKGELSLVRQQREQFFDQRNAEREIVAARDQEIKGLRASLEEALKPKTQNAAVLSRQLLDACPGAQSVIVEYVRDRP